MKQFGGVRPLLDEAGAFEALDEAGGERLTARRRIPEDEPFFAGHFPALPVVPGVFAVEALAECARQLLRAKTPEARSFYPLAAAPTVRFRRRVLPGDTLELSVRRTGTEGALHRFEAAAAVGGHQAVQAVLLLGPPGPGSCSPKDDSGGRGE